MALYHNTSIPTRGLVVCLDAANPRSYPGSGLNWYDLSGKRSHCAFQTTAPTWSNGVFSFNGQYGIITYSSAHDFSREQTVVMLMKPTNTTDRRNPWNQAYGGYGTWTDECASNYTSHYYGDGAGDALPYTAITTSSITRDTWHLIAVSRDTDRIDTYRNGAWNTGQTHTYGVLATHSTNIQIGLGYTGAYWTGDISAVLAYNVALTAEEHAQIFRAYRKRVGL